MSWSMDSQVMRGVQRDIAANAARASLQHEIQRELRAEGPGQPARRPSLRWIRRRSIAVTRPSQATTR